MMSDFRYEIKTSLPVNWLETIDTKNPGRSVRNELNNWPADPGWSGWWWRCWRTCPRTDPPNVWQFDLKKRKNVNTHPIHIIIDHHFLNWLCQIFLMWSQINVRSSIRLTGSRQIDFKVSSLCCRNIFRKFLKF